MNNTSGGENGDNYSLPIKSRDYLIQNFSMTLSDSLVYFNEKYTMSRSFYWSVVQSIEQQHGVHFKGPFS